MPLPPSPAQDQYRKDVWKWGSDKPWAGRPSLSHKTVFSWADVRTDKAGNLISIDGVPILTGKPCFGRPEYFFRHGHLKGPDALNKWGKPVETYTRCGRCKIRDACSKLNLERVESDPGMKAALMAWRDHYTALGGGRRYTGKSGWSWTAFKRAVADRGPFDSFNDDALAERERLAVIERRRKAADKKREQRALRKLLKLPPDQSYVVAAKRERDKRRESLFAATQRDGCSRALRRLPAHSCGVMADAWLGQTILEASSQKVNASAVAKWMIDQGRNHGLGQPSLRARLVRDFDRIRELESGSDGTPVWLPFDPDADE